MILRVAFKTRIVVLLYSPFGRRINDVFGVCGLNVLFAVAVTTGASGGAPVFHEPGTFAVKSQGEGVHNTHFATRSLVALRALRSLHSIVSVLCCGLCLYGGRRLDRGLRLDSGGPIGFCKSKE